jgi:hypothetical protein
MFDTLIGASIYAGSGHRLGRTRQRCAKFRAQFLACLRSMVFSRADFMQQDLWVFHIECMLSGPGDCIPYVSLTIHVLFALLPMITHLLSNEGDGRNHKIALIEPNRFVDTHDAVFGRTRRRSTAATTQMLLS